MAFRWCWRRVYITLLYICIYLSHVGQEELKRVYRRIKTSTEHKNRSFTCDLCRAGALTPNSGKSAPVQHICQGIWSMRHGTPCFLSAESSLPFFLILTHPSHRTFPDLHEYQRLETFCERVAMSEAENYLVSFLKLSP